MKEIVIPKTELKVSALCLGGGPHGVDPEESERFWIIIWLLVETLLTPPIFTDSGSRAAEYLSVKGF